ncbi:MAG: hypothetical protein KDC71_15160 [Acidobacteria bacterium]|nr:hypothetical protein [Acidobacteriota bacterium]
MFCFTKKGSLIFLLGLVPLFAQSHYAQLDLTEKGVVVAKSICYFSANGNGHDLYVYVQGRNDAQMTLIGVVKPSGAAHFYSGSDQAAFWSQFVQRNQISANLRFFKPKSLDGFEELQLDAEGNSSFSIRAHHVIDDYCGTGRPKWPIPLGVTVTPEPICPACNEPDPQPAVWYLGAMHLSPLAQSAFWIGTISLDVEQGISRMSLPRAFGKSDPRVFEAQLKALIPAELP